MKTYLIRNAGHTKKQIVSYSHRLPDLLSKILELEPKSELRFLENKIGLYPEVSARYSAGEISPKDLWAMYYAAQIAGAIVLRPMSDRNSAAAIKMQQ